MLSFFLAPFDVTQKDAREIVRTCACSNMDVIETWTFLSSFQSGLQKYVLYLFPPKGPELSLEAVGNND